MDDPRRDHALGALLLALVLIASSGVVALFSGAGPAPVPLDATAAPPNTPAIAAVALGWPVRSDQGDPEAWEQLPGVGTVLAGRLSMAAGEGALESPEQLLRVRGIGATMAADLAPRIEWVVAAGSDR